VKLWKYKLWWAHFPWNLFLEFDFIIFSVLYFFFSNTSIFSFISSITFLLTKLLWKKYFLCPSLNISNLKVSPIYFIYFEEIFKFWYLKPKHEVCWIDEERSQGCDFIYLIPFKEPVLLSGSFASNPFINSFAYFEIWGYFGNLGSEFIIAMKISYFLGA